VSTIARFDLDISAVELNVVLKGALSDLAEGFSTEEFHAWFKAMVVPLSKLE
jgi:hypothetical protein